MTKSKNTRLDKHKPYGEAPFEALQYCVRCCLPSSEEGTSFDCMGMCPSCQSSEQKMHINWAEREKGLRIILGEAQKKAKGYEILVPISGGKDSAFQLHVLKNIYKMKILACTFSHNWFSETGKYNLWNILEKMNIDHIMFTPNRELVNKIARESLYQIGDSCWHCHSGVGAFPLQVAVKYRVPLIVWGESLAERDGRATYKKPVKYDRDYFTKVSARKYPEEMVNERSGLTLKDMLPFELPTQEEIEAAGVSGIHLGDYLFWDEQRQTEFLKKKYDWREDYVEGTYKGYKSVECIMPGVHDYCKFVKRGFGRTTDHASDDVRIGLMTREEAFEIIKKLDGERPDALDDYLRMTGLTEEEFHRILESQRQGPSVNLPKYKNDSDSQKNPQKL